MSDSYLKGYMAAERGEPREYLNPWNAQDLKEWLRGYDEFHESKKSFTSQ